MLATRMAFAVRHTSNGQGTAQSVCTKTAAARVERAQAATSTSGKRTEALGAAIEARRLRAPPATPQRAGGKAVVAFDSTSLRPATSAQPALVDPPAGEAPLDPCATTQADATGDTAQLTPTGAGQSAREPASSAPVDAAGNTSELPPAGAGQGARKPAPSARAVDEHPGGPGAAGGAQPTGCQSG